MKRFWLSLFAGSALTLASLTGCGAAPMSTEAGAPAPMADAAMESAVDMAGGEALKVAQNTAPGAEQAESDAVSSVNTTNRRPQLIKRANLSLSVESVDDAFNQVRSIITAQQGDVLSLNDSGDRQRRISYQLRVPQERLDATLDALTELGTVTNRSISTEDVSSQLVDLEARISNARKSEAALQEIMSRSGDISDVLEVSRELSNVRQNIEQMAAQQKGLQTQVRYSTISLSLQSAIAQAPTKPAFSRQLANSWGAATNSVGNFTTDLLQLGLWLLAYSPYIAVLLCGAVAVRKLRRGSKTS